MDVFELRQGLIDTYRDYATSFMRIRDQRIRTQVDEALDSGELWPLPFLRRGSIPFSTFLRFFRARLLASASVTTG